MTKTRSNKFHKKVIVFDLDDTIGHFEEVSIFLSGLQNIVDENIKDKYLHKLLELWPKFLRYGILDILNIIKQAKMKDSNVKVIIYTNNMGNRSWTLIIKKFLEKKIHYKLFDKIITAYRPCEKNNCRTTNEKTYDDLIKCTGYNKNTQFLFLDDQYHEKMLTKDLKYLKLRPFVYSIPFNTMINNYINSPYSHIIKNCDVPLFKKYMIGYLNSGKGYNKYIIKKTKIDKLDIKQKKYIISELNNFLKHNNPLSSNRRTRKRLTPLNI